MKYKEAACLKSLGGEPVVLEGVRAEGDLRGVVLEMTVEQRFSNPAEANLEVVYTFPLPWGAVLLGVDVELGGKRLQGTVVEKKQAEASYEEALSEGNAAIMLEKGRDHSYSLNLGNLAAKETCVVTLRYAQVLSYEQRGLRVMVPTVIAPRYGDAVRQGRMRPHQVPTTDMSAEYPFDITLRLHGDLAKARVATPSHPSAMSTCDGVLTVALARKGALDRDFVLVVDQLAHDAVGLQANDSYMPGHVVALASFCPRVDAKTPARVAAKILVDCSGSMAGDSIEAAKRALQAVVLQLGAGDKFSLSRFGSTVAHRSRGLWSVTETTRLGAQRWVGGLEADLGGTEMEDALTSTFALTPADGADVLLVTDGEIHAIDSTIAAARASGHRLFVVGVGSSPAESHLRRLAEATGGACDFVAAGEAVEPAVMRMFARLRSPRLTNVHLDWPEGVTPTWVSALGTAVFDGDTANVFALVKDTLSGTVTLRGTRSDGELQKIGSIAFSGQASDESLLARVAASVRVKAMEAEADEIGAKAIAEMAAKYQLVSMQTNFLLVHERAADKKAMEMPQLHSVRQMVPAGWAGTGKSVREARFAAPAFAADVQFSLADDSLSHSIPSVLYSTVGGVRLSKKLAGLSLSSTLFGARSAGAERLASRTGDAAIRLDARFWSDSGDDSGLTPAGVGEWLRTHPAQDWPKSYEDLKAIGLSEWVSEWLQLGAGASNDELDVVAAFLLFMSEPSCEAALDGADNRAAAVGYSGDILSGNDRKTQLEKLALYFETTLRDATAESWPDAVYALSA